MFPYHVNYQSSNLPFYFNYEPQHQTFYPQVFPLFQNHLIPSPDQIYLINSKANSETHDEIKKLYSFQDIIQSNSIKKKRITKKLTQVSLTKSKDFLAKKSNSKYSSFKYFDPTQAPPITSLRNRFETEVEINKKLLQTKSENQKIDCSSLEIEKKIKNLELFLKQPDETEFPFLICKKRKYFRNVKRRYSVVYFEQRAYFIQSKIPIPSQLQPKNKNKKSVLSEADQQNVNQFGNQNDQSFIDEKSQQNFKPKNLQVSQYLMQSGKVKMQVKEEPYLNE